MGTVADQDPEPLNSGTHDLVRIREDVAAAQRELAEVHLQLSEGDKLIAQEQVGRLMQANEHLVLATLAAQRASEASAQAIREMTGAAQRDLLTGLPALGLAERASDNQHALLQAANTQLVLAAISAQELQAAAEEAQQRQARFLAVLAHELRNPLAPISAAATLLGRVRPETPTLSKLQAIIERQVKTINRLVEDLIDMSRVNAGKLELELELVDICALVNDVVETCRPKMDARLQALSILVPQAQLQVMGDPVRLTQVLTNLLDNASKYTPAGGRVGIAVTLAHDKVVIAVADNGIGITEEALSAIFEPFVQEQHATVFNGVGLGIGLTVVRELVEAHGGRVEVSSPGRDCGSEFVLTFPLAAKQIV